MLKLNLKELEELMKKALPSWNDENAYVNRELSEEERRSEKKATQEIINASPSILKTLRAYESAIESLRGMEVNPFCSERLSKCGCREELHSMQYEILNSLDTQRDSILTQLEKELE